MTRIKFVGTLDGKEREIVVDDRDQNDHKYAVSVDGHDYTVDAFTMNSGIVSALIDNKSYDIDIDRTGKSENTLDGRLAVRVRGRVVDLEMLDERRKKLKEAQASRSIEEGVARVTSPMPGKIIRLMVNPGEQVKQGQGLVVIEAMKMENEIRATKAGTIKEVFGKVGESVDGAALLLTLE